MSILTDRTLVARNDLPSATASVLGVLALAGDFGGTALSPTAPSKMYARVPTSVKTSNYSASPGDFVPCNVASGTLTVTLPTTPADRTVVGVKKVDASGVAVSVAAGGSDVIDTAGTTTWPLSLQYQAVTFVYGSAAATWYVVSGLLPLVQLLASPAFTGTPTAPTATAGTNTTQIASTAFVTAAASLLAPLASPALTGTPTAPTASSATNTTQLATTAFVQTAVSTLAALASPTFTGTPAAPTAAVGTNTTQLATTAFVQTSALTTGGTTAMNSSQTTAFTASAGGFYPCSTSSAAFTATLPTAPSNGTTCVFMKTDTSTNVLTISRGGSTDVINSSGTTSVALVYMNSVAVLKYNSSSAVWYNVEANNVGYTTWLVQGGTRQTGYGDMPEGIFVPQAATLLAVQFRIGTADASGTSAAQLYSNTTNASTGTAISGASVSSAAWSTANTKTLVAGPWTIAAGTYIQCDVTSVGTTPGNRLYADLYLVMN